jgi:hypothetical protein
MEAARRQTRCVNARLPPTPTLDLGETILPSGGDMLLT